MAYTVGSFAERSGHFFATVQTFSDSSQVSATVRYKTTELTCRTRHVLAFSQDIDIYAIPFVLLVASIEAVREM